MYVGKNEVPEGKQVSWGRVNYVGKKNCLSKIFHLEKHDPLEEHYCEKAYCNCVPGENYIL